MGSDEQIMLMLSKMSQKIEGLDQKIEGMNQKLDFVYTTVINIENEHGAKLQVLIDGQVAAEEKLVNHEPRIIKLEEKSAKHDVELAHLLRKVK